MQSVLANDKFDAHAGERTLQVVIGALHVFGTDVDRVRVEFRQYLGHSFLYEVVDVDRVDVLVVDNMQQIIESVGTAVDDVEPVSREVIGIEGANQDAYDDAQGQEQGHEIVLIHCR